MNDIRHACQSKVGNWAKFYNNGPDDERTHNKANEIGTRTVDSVSKDPAHDDAGNMTDDGENYKYLYDFRNRLVQVKRRGDDSLLAAYSYDGLGRRIRKIVYQSDGETEDSDTRYLYDGERVIEERNENGSHKLLARYIYGTLYIDEPLRMYRDGNGDEDFDDAEDTNVYYLQDRLFNVVALTGTDGAVLERVWYECYGKPTNRRASDNHEQPASHFANPYLFTARELDAETGLYNYRARYYAAGLGRFVSRDPVEADINLYRYCGNGPLVSVDALGLADDIEALGAANLGTTLTIRDAVRFPRSRSEFYDVTVQIDTTYGYFFADKKFQFTIPKPTSTVSVSLQKATPSALHDVKGTATELFRFTKSLSTKGADLHKLSAEECSTECVAYMVFVSIFPAGFEFDLPKVAEEQIKGLGGKLTEGIGIGPDIGKKAIEGFAAKVGNAIPQNLRGRIGVHPFSGVANAYLVVCADREYLYTTMNVATYEGLKAIGLQGNWEKEPNVSRVGPVPLPIPPKKGSGGTTVK